LHRWIEVGANPGAPFPLIERGRLDAVTGIVVHQTNASTAQSSFNSYSRLDKDGKAPNGAHFMIDKDGSITQTASLYRVTNHVGLLQSRSVLTKKCTPTELIASNALEKIVVKPNGRVEDIYEPVNDQQNASLAWLVQQLVERFGVSMQEIYRHPQIGRKTPTEASTAKW
jgi:N-acetyl-anhydromuramyl-L-alanine amidase AmpD